MNIGDGHFSSITPAPLDFYKIYKIHFFCSEICTLSLSNAVFSRITNPSHKLRWVVSLVQ